MTVSDRLNTAGMEVAFEIEKAPISISYNLSNPSRVTMRHANNGRRVIDRNANDALLAFMPYTKGVTQAPPGRSVGVSIYFSVHLFAELFQDLPVELMAACLSRTNYAQTNPIFAKSQFDWDTWLILKQIVACPYRGNIRKIFLEAKALELTAKKLYELEKKYCNASADLAGRELDLVREAYHLLVKNMSEPPSLHDLSREVGINRNKLNKGFKQLYGMTVFQVLRSKRLSTAWEMLQGTDLSMTEIAHLVGYTDQANFTNAFRKHFGKTPRTVRQKQ